MAELIYLVVLLAALVGGYVLYQRKQRELLDDALEITCLLCDSAYVEVLSTGGTDHYQCRLCGYHTDLTLQPDTAALVETFRDIKRAVEYLQEARALLDEPSYEAGTLNSMTGQSDEELEARVNRLVQSGLSLLGDLTEQHPELLEIPRVGKADSASRPLDGLLLVERGQRALPAHYGPKQKPDEADEFSAWVKALEEFRDDYAQHVREGGRGPKGL